MIIIDSTFHVVHFHRCHIRRSFWPVSVKKWHSCSFGDIRSASVCTIESQNRRRHTSLSISTETGKVVVPKVNNDFQLLVEAFEIIVPENDEEYLIECEGMHIVTIYGTIVGLLLGGFPARNDSDAILAESTVGGAIASCIVVLISRGKAFYPLLHGMIGMFMSGAAMFPMFGFDSRLPRIAIY